jgi:hypothetical protein|nr:MAG TPA: excisionase [Caudoviricetes sp.]DAY72285.1 MAG TPA: excisionase [Caudoviricetes sp.]
MMELEINIPIWRKILLTPDEATELFGLPAQFFRVAGTLTKRGQYDLPCCWIGSHLKINRPKLEKWLEDKSDGITDFKTSHLLEKIKENTPRRGRKRKER